MTLNLLKGAQLTGHIISDWNPNDERIQKGTLPDRDLMTALNFGVLESDMVESDKDFSMRYQGNIIGKSLKVAMKGGTTVYNGLTDVHSFSLGSDGMNDNVDLVTVINGSPTLIRANEITLFTNEGLGVGSRLGLLGNSFTYGTAIDESTPYEPLVLIANGGKLRDDGAQLVNPGQTGSFSVGMYDYSYDNMRLNGDETRKALLVDINKRVNKSRTGKAAVAAPLAMAVHNPATALLSNRMMRRFSASQDGLGRTNKYYALLGQHYPTTLDANNVAGLASNLHTHGTMANGAGEGPWLANSFGGSELQHGNRALWITPSYSYTHQTGDIGYDIKTPSLSMGMDYTFEGGFIGGAFSFAMPEYESGHADVDGKTSTIMLYGGLDLPASLELGLFAAYSHSRYEQDRKVHGQTYESDYSSDMYSAGVNLVRSFFLDENWLIRPFAGYEYMHFRNGSYNENHGIYGLDFDSYRNDLHKFSAGTDLGYVFEEGAFLSGRVSYIGLYGDRKAKTDVTFELDPQRNAFQTKGDSLDEHSLGLSLYGGLPLNESVELLGGYNYMVGKESNTHQASFNFMYRF